MAIWLLATAHAASVDEDQLAVLRDAVTPAVERAVGRRLIERPPVRIAQEATVLAELADATRTRLEAEGAPPAEARATAERLAHAVVDDALAVYSGDPAVVYVVKEHMEAWLAAYDVPDNQLQAACSCVLAHELVHALQDQYAPVPAEVDGDVPLRRRALAEGQAEVVQSLVCTGGLSGAMTLLEEGAPARAIGAGQPAPDSPAFFYDYGAAWVADLWRREGSEAVWRAFAAPPTVQEVTNRVDALRADPWWRGDWIAPLAAGLHGGAPRGKAERSSLTALIRALMPGAPLVGLPRSSGGLVYEGEADGAAVMLGAWALPPGVTAAMFVEARQHELERFVRGDAGTRLFLDVPASYTKARLDPLEGLPDAFVLRLEPRGAYTEAWVEADGRLLLAATTGVRVRPRTHAQALAALLARVPARPEPPAPVPPAGEPKDVPPAWTWLGSRAWAALSAKDWARCLAEVERIDPAADPRARDVVASAGSACAHELGDLGAVERIVARVGGWDPLPDLLRVSHAARLAEQGRAADALRVLESWLPEDPEALTAAADVRIFAAWKLRSWKALAGYARDRSAPPERRAEAAVALANAGRFDDAARILAITCPELPAGRRGECDALRASLSR